MDLESIKNGFRITSITPVERSIIKDDLCQRHDLGEPPIIQALLGLLSQKEAPIEISFTIFKSQFPTISTVQVDRTVAKFGLELENVENITINFRNKQARRTYRRMLSASLINNPQGSRAERRVIYHTEDRNPTMINKRKSSRPKSRWY